MEQRQLGIGGPKVSSVGLGCNNFGGRLDQDATNAVVSAALSQGITLFDTADVYGNQGGSEEMLGKALGKERGAIVLASKFGHDMGADGKGADPAYIRRALDASLKRLGTDYLDLYQLHTPDPLTPLADTLGTLDELVKEGKVRAVGCSNLPAAQVYEAAQIAKAKQQTAFICAQDEYSLLVRGIEHDLIPALADLEMGLLPYFPLASGLLTGKYQPGILPAGTRFASSKGAQDRYMTPENWAKVQALQAFATARNHTLLELAFSWLAAQPVVSSVIAGATRPEQIEQNVAAADWQLSAEDLSEIDRITAGEVAAA
ncbi:aldo/keto reductase [Deinococcus detaillensis]|uniref:Aldo/keto reductase n=1 Tax=Deinococcus detaillensis TaxID=2592048 RepID=A0A553V0C6_9DEIO|nr:aldo/keto reductase [Deinococcus detaillensis]TSA85924.1 aldo/keto reductase [Deinococcus detaillensis]